jgi:predicted dehydrogenase
VAGRSTGQPVRLAIIGCGGMARRHVRSFAELAEKAPEAFAIEAVCDVDESRARALAQDVARFQAVAPHVYTEVARLLDQARPEAADVVLPHFQHHTVVTACLEAGAHVLTEKPLALTIRAGRRMLAAAKRAGKVLAVAEQARRGPAARTLHWAINRAGLIGEPRMLFAQNTGYSLGVIAGTPWRHDRLQAGGGWVLDGEVHYIDLLRYVFGDVQEVYARLAAFEPARYLDPDGRAHAVPSTVEDTAMAVLTFERGLLGTFTWTQSAPGRGFRHRRYYGSEGSIDGEGLARLDGTQRTLDELRQDFLASLSGDERERLFPLGIMDDITLELYDFLTAIRDGHPPEIDGLEGLRDMAVCEAFYESNLAGRPVRVADVLNGHIEAYQRPINEHWGI